jgi:hypothetical protein
MNFVKYERILTNGAISGIEEHARANIAEDTTAAMKLASEW